MVDRRISEISLNFLKGLLKNSTKKTSGILAWTNSFCYGCITSIDDFICFLEKGISSQR